MRHLLNASVCSLAILYAVSAHAEHQHQSHAPIGVMGDHLMPKGEWMAAYRYDLTSQTGLRDGGSSIDKQQVLAVYGEAPLKMQMGMHMLEGMVGVTDKLTLMAMGQIMAMDMTHQAHGAHGHMHAMDKQGLGDTQVSALYGLMHSMDENMMHEMHVNAGLSLPTGSTEEDYVNHHATLLHLPYNMQLGSGTYDPSLGLTYTGATTDGWSWGAQAIATFRFGENSEDYRLGDKQVVTFWGTRTLTDWVEASLRLEGMHWGNVHGRDSRIPLTSMPVSDPNQAGGEQVNAYFGLGFTPPVKALESSKLGLEFGAPVYQHFDGPQLETDYRLVLGWQIGF